MPKSRKEMIAHTDTIWCKIGQEILGGSKSDGIHDEESY